MKPLKLILPILFMSSLAFAQGSFAGFTVMTPTGNAIAGASVAVCTTLPGPSTPCSGTALQTTYTDITVAVQCTKNALVLGPLSGAGCTNPGYTDSFGNAQIFALGGLNYYQAWGYGISNTYVSPLPFPALTAGIGTINNVTAINGLTGGGIGPTVTLGLITSCSPNNVLLWNGSTWVCSTAGTGTLTGATTAGTSGLIGGGLTGTLALSMRTDCAATQTEVWSGTSWNCGANGTGTVTGVTATTGGGLVAGGIVTAPTLGLITSCGNNQVLQWNGAAWVCGTIAGGSGTPGGSNTQVQVNNSGAFGAYPFFTVNSATSTVNMTNGSVSNQFTVAGAYFNNTTWPSTPPGVCAFGVGSCPSTTSIGTDQAGHLSEIGFNNAAGGGEYLLSTPAANQTITQAVGTTFAVNNISNVRYVTPSFNWVQSPAADLSVAGAKTVTLTPCPSGITGTDPNLWVYVAAQGTPEAVLVTAGSCTPGAASGTLTFTTVNTHAAGYTVGSATSGAYEALRDATPTNNNNVRLVFPPTNPPASIYYTFYAPVTVLGGMVDIDGNGATIDVQAKRAAFVMPTQNGGQVRIHGFRAGSRTTYAPAAITQTACAANVATITTALNPAVGEYVDVQGTFNNHYWGPHKVVTTSGANWTYTDTNCGGVGSYSAQATVGGNAYQWAFIETNTTSTEVFGISLNPPGGFSAPFNSAFVVLNDQALHIHDIDVAGLAGCTSAYCSNLVYAPGPFSPNASVIYADAINGTLNCTGNGFTLYSGNTAHLSNVVIQGFTQWSLVTGPVRGGFGPTTLTNLYNEVGGCSNPLYPGSGLQKKAMAGVISWGGRLSIRGGESPIGNLPLFANTGDGGTQYNYYLIAKDTGGSNFGPSAPLLCGQAQVDSVTPAGSITVACPRINGPIPAAGDVITYDLLRVAGTGNTLVHPNGSNCGGGTTIACGSVLTAQAQCATAVCSFTDNAASNTTAYVVPAATYYPYLQFWPGALVLTALTDTNNISIASQARASVEDLNFITNVSPIISVVQSVPTVSSAACVVSTPGVWISCLGGDSVGNSNARVVGTLLQNGPASGGGIANLKGRLNFIVPGSLINTDVLTIVDSQPRKTIANPFFRPTADALDAAICTDNGSVAVTAAQLCVRAPIAVSAYIASLPDGTSWLERLTASLKTFKVPVNATSLTIPTAVQGQTFASDGSGLLTQSSANIDVKAGGFSGADMCAQIANAWTAAAGGTLDARGYTGDQACATNMFGSSNPAGMLLLGRVTIHVQVPQVRPSRMIVRGGGYKVTTNDAGTIFRACAGGSAGVDITCGGVTLANASNVAVPTIACAGTAGTCGSQTQFGTRFENVTFDGNGLASVTLEQEYTAQEQSGCIYCNYINWGNSGKGLDIGGGLATAQNSDFEHLYFAIPNVQSAISTCTTAAVPLKVNTGGSGNPGPRVIADVTIDPHGCNFNSATGVAPFPIDDFQLNGTSMKVEDIHMEYAAVGLHVSGIATTNSVTLSGISTANMQLTTASNAVCNGQNTNASTFSVLWDSAFTYQNMVALQIKANTPGAATYVLNDCSGGANGLITAGAGESNSLAFYVVGPSGKNVNMNSAAGSVSSITGMSAGVEIMATNAVAPVPSCQAGNLHRESINAPTVPAAPTGCLDGQELKFEVTSAGTNAFTFSNAAYVGGVTLSVTAGKFCTEIFTWNATQSKAYFVAGGTCN